MQVGITGRAVRRAVVAVLLVLAVGACSRDANRLPTAELVGGAMGTTWNARLVAPPAGLDNVALTAELDALFAAIEQSMSTYRPDSELSRFNAAQSTDWYPVSAELCVLAAQSLAISRSTDGAFDVTVGPLVNLWGFGPGGATAQPPEAERIAAALPATGFDKLQADCAQPALRKSVPALYVDLSAIAKGYAVDRAAELLLGRGVRNFMLELGGEVRVSGENAARGPWRIALEKPVEYGRVVQTVMLLSDVAVATSGDYRNFFEHGGRRYSHAIDPRSGYPVRHTAFSVSVLAETAAEADALATALLVLGPEEGLSYADTHDLAASYLLQEGDAFELRSSDRFVRAGYIP